MGARNERLSEQVPAAWHEALYAVKDFRRHPFETAIFSDSALRLEAETRMSLKLTPQGTMAIVKRLASAKASELAAEE